MSERNNGSVPIFQACWDEFGRAKFSCKKFGLCNAQGCWAWQDACCDGPTGGCDIVINDNDGTGVMNVLLDPTKAIQQNAILENEILYVDFDFPITNVEHEFNSVTVKKGEYLLQQNNTDPVSYSYFVNLEYSR